MGMGAEAVYWPLPGDRAEDGAAWLGRGLQRWRGSGLLGPGPRSWTRTSKPGLGGAKEASLRGSVQAGAGRWDWSPGGWDSVSSAATPLSGEIWSRRGGAGWAGRWDARGHAAFAGAFLALQPGAEERPG